MSDTDKASKIAGYLEELREHTSANGTYAYRGQENAEWGVESSAYRRLKNSDSSSPDWERFLSYHREQILEPARMNGYGFKDGHEFHDVELLAELQHYGAATCLIDFTRDFLVALWFACQIYKDKKDEETIEQNGKVFILNINDAQVFRSLEQEDMKERIEAILNFQTREGEEKSEGTAPRVQDAFYWHWSPYYMNQRILKQNSLFVFGKQEIAKDHIVGNIEIEKGNKKKVLDELKTLGITRESLFKDMTGFASSHGHSEPMPLEYKSAEDYYRAGNDAIQKGQWEKAETSFSGAISRKSDYASAYLNRGITRVAIGKFEDALEDCVNAKKFGLHGPIVRRIQGGAKYFKGDYEGAKAELISAINDGLHGASIHYELGAVYVALSDTDKARQSFRLAKELAEKSNNNKLAQRAEQQLNKLESVDNEK